jgi:hypothetical protein
VDSPRRFSKKLAVCTKVGHWIASINYGLLYLANRRTQIAPFQTPLPVVTCFKDWIASEAWRREIMAISDGPLDLVQICASLVSTSILVSNRIIIYLAHRRRGGPGDKTMNDIIGFLLATGPWVSHLKFRLNQALNSAVSNCPLQVKEAMDAGNGVFPRQAADTRAFSHRSELPHSFHRLLFCRSGQT